MFSPPGAVMPMPMVIPCYGLNAGLTLGYAESATAPASATGPAANQAIYVPFVVTQPTTWTRGFWYNGSAPDGANNVSVGIYDEAGTRQATTGNVLLSGASVIQQAAFAASVLLLPGVYYMAIEFSIGADLNGTTAYSASSSIQRGRMGGLYTQAVGSNPLPATATFATWSSQVMPVFGVARTSFAL